MLSSTGCAHNSETSQQQSAPATLATNLDDPDILRNPQDNVVRIFGAGGPQVAFQRAALLFKEKTNTSVEVVFGPESKWSTDAQRSADILWGTAEQSMTAFLETYTTFDSSSVEPLYIRPAVIAVQKGNPKNITGFSDLLKPEMRIVVVEGAGVYNTSGTGVWEDIAGRNGVLSDVVKFRKNIIAFAKGSGAGFKAFKEQQADAWITWSYWPIDHLTQADTVALSEERVIWRDISVVVAPDADPQATAFVQFLKTNEVKQIFAEQGMFRD